MNQSSNEKEISVQDKMLDSIQSFFTISTFKTAHTHTPFEQQAANKILIDLHLFRHTESFHYLYLV